ncbi:TetR/AcrR family transcriptional regulator [Marinitenerispora sediminis]|uniref:TetR/AcrR family transcriptional regulator n=1 Tax=Marinitenerispora sediminis TaxID=1931232 RepID=A0A368T0B1_9ACTN|nr:TetR/AcrR family transcriptional regulator [Marinitenerispora sediminis]RCV49272.1 TetR/AcrR family transcriptional regulator [Marinitenerispora sediminis]RCV52393.1 TetR/AcrR family transcriptional regulator [Marinitenerispora sediminis]
MDPLDERAERILDAAGELLTSLGYRRVTIDDVARRADVGKGTVYLHWRTKDALFLSVLLRTKGRSIGAQGRRMAADPAEVLLSRMARAMYLDLVGDPVARVGYSGDAETLGRLTRTAAGSFEELRAEARRVSVEHLRLLREHGLVTTDLDPETQLFAFHATTTGFFLHPSFAPSFVPKRADQQATALEHTVRAAFETTPDPGGLAAAASEAATLYQRLEKRYLAELHRQFRA